MSPMAELIVDGVLALLLIAAIAACWIVYRRLGTIRAGQAELKALVDSLNAAVLEAQRSVSNLKHSSTEIEQKLGSQVQKAKVLADELTMITEAGNNLADRIEGGLTNARSKGQEPTREVDEKLEAVSAEQKALLDALKEAR